MVVFFCTGELTLRNGLNLLMTSDYRFESFRCTQKFFVDGSSIMEVDLYMVVLVQS
ncbi:unnamed protein product [Coffea canephora]|uniref:DH200=94 genomic scaffold, scaffold_338 n=1 Tax=Coffea canephora TaxID=49390 RepID=A0A068VH98_COFCA|nr:unnamed protein product [Coffea canephora]